MPRKGSLLSSRSHFAVELPVPDTAVDVVLAGVGVASDVEMPGVGVAVGVELPGVGVAV